MAISLYYPWKSWREARGVVDSDDLPHVQPGSWVAIDRHADPKDPTSEATTVMAQVVKLRGTKKLTIRRWADYTTPTGSRVAGPEIDPLIRHQVFLTVSVDPENITWYAGTYKGKKAALARGAVFAWEAPNAEGTGWDQHKLEIGDEFAMQHTGEFGKGTTRVRVDEFDTETYNRTVIFYTEIG